MLHCLIYTSALSKLRTIISPILQIRKPRFREVSKLYIDELGVGKNCLEERKQVGKTMS